MKCGTDVYPEHDRALLQGDAFFLECHQLAQSAIGLPQ